MSNVSKMLKEWDTKESKAKREKWFKEYLKKEKTRLENIKNLMTSTTYMDWLKKFTQNKDGFSDDEWLYFPEKISDYDRTNVEMLNLFYEGIDKYAKQNYIYPTPCEFGNFYRVKLNDFGIEIGILMGQGTVFFCRKVLFENDKEFIDFNYVMNGKKQDNVDTIDTTLDYLSNMVISAYEKGVPIEAIANKLDNTIKNISLEKESKSKIKEK